MNQGQKVLPQLVEEEIPKEEERPPIVFVNRNQDTD